MVDKIKVVYYESVDMKHNWKIYLKGNFVGYMHCEDDGLIGGYIGDALTRSIKHWKAFSDACLEDLVDKILLEEE